MTVEQRTLGDVTILDIEGRMTIEFLDRPVRATVRRLLSEGRKHFLLNLDRVPYLDSTGLAEIVEAYLTTARHGGVLKLEYLSRHTRELLRITRLSTVMEVFDSETVALTSFGAPPSQLENFLS
jgi:anti-sigma B factor antagonist